MHYFISIIISILIFLVLGSMLGFAKVTGCMTGWKGKAGNLVFSMWKGTQVVKTRTVPLNPRSPYQQANRDILRKIVKVLRPHEEYYIGPYWNPFAVPGKSGWGNAIRENMLVQDSVFDLELFMFSKGILESLKEVEATYATATGHVAATWSDVCYFNGNGLDSVGVIVVNKDTLEPIFSAPSLNIREDMMLGFTIPTGLNLSDIRIFFITSDLVIGDDIINRVTTSQIVTPTAAI